MLLYLKLINLDVERFAVFQSVCSGCVTSKAEARESTSGCQEKV